METRRPASNAGLVFYKDFGSILNKKSVCVKTNRSKHFVLLLKLYNTGRRIAIAIKGDVRALTFSVIVPPE
jgi:hypothetical protein